VKYRVKRRRGRAKEKATFAFRAAEDLRRSIGLCEGELKLSSEAS